MAPEAVAAVVLTPFPMEVHHAMKTITSIVLLVFSAALIRGCVTTASPSLNSTLWMQTAAEYRASARQTYNAAASNLEAAIQDSQWTAALEQDGAYAALPAAVLMDIDETVLSNSNYHAQLVVDGTRWNPATWDAWVALGEASAVPGAVDFIQTAREQKVTVIFVTNRKCQPRKGSDLPCPQEQDTIDNLRTVGIQDVQPEHIFLQNERPAWTSEKTSRREVIARQHRILMVLGDDLGDFLPDVKRNITPHQRAALVNQYKGHWGRKWYLLSNPVYGSWLRILGNPQSAPLTGYNQRPSN
jgi:acid phosphatase